MTDAAHDPDADPEDLTMAAKPEACQVIERAEFTEDGWIVLHLDDGSTRSATEEEVETYRILNHAHGEAFVMNHHRAFEGDPGKRLLPRHRPPTFKDPGKTVAPRLPRDVFGAPRATR